MSNEAVRVGASELRFAYAQSRLAEIERTRLVYLAAESGMPQREIARVVHMSQASVHRVIARARVLGIGPSVEEVVLQRQVERLSTEEMFERLAGLDSWVPREVDPVDGVLPGSSEEDVESLLADGFLSEAETDRSLDPSEADQGRPGVRRHEL